MLLHGEFLDRGAWWAAVHGVTQSQTGLKQLSMHACIGEGNGISLQYSCMENPKDGGAWRAAIYVVAQSRTRLKRLSSSSSSNLWEKLGEGYVRPVCTIYATSFESIIISKLNAIKNLTYIKHLE